MCQKNEFVNYKIRILLYSYTQHFLRRKKTRYRALEQQDKQL